MLDKFAPAEKPKVLPELINPNKAFPNEAIWELRDLMPGADAAQLTIGPYTPEDAFACEIEPVRVAGWRKSKGEQKPIPHAKLLVLGEVGVESFGPDFWPDYHTECRFSLQR